MSTEPDAPPSDDDATRQDDAEDDLASLEHFPQLVRRADLTSWRGTFPLPEHPTLCIRLPDGKIVEVEHDPRLKKLDWRDRQKFLISALAALAITPHEYLDHGSFFLEAHADPSMHAQWLKIARIVRAAYYEAENVNSEFLKKADAAARAALEQHCETYLFSARSVAFEHLRDELAIWLEQGLETESIATCLWTAMFEAKYHEIAQHIPDLERATISTRKMLTKLETVRTNPATHENFNEQAEAMIRAWLRAMGCPVEIVKSAFDAERARDERKNEKRKPK